MKKRKKPFGIISDLHGNAVKHLAYSKQYEYTVQVGDLGFSYEYLKDIDPAKHKFIGGNHDNYTVLTHRPPDHYLGDFGSVALGGLNFFFVRGAWSIDINMRTPGISWWPEEELSLRRLQEAVDAYAAVKPNVMMTHDCPRSVVEHVSDPMMLVDFGHDIDHQTNTQLALQKMLEIHQPRYWYFGHYHRHKPFMSGSTLFYCIGVELAIEPLAME